MPRTVHGRHQEISAREHTDPHGAITTITFKSNHVGHAKSSSHLTAANLILLNPIAAASPMLQLAAAVLLLLGLAVAGFILLNLAAVALTVLKLAAAVIGLIALLTAILLLLELAAAALLLLMLIILVAATQVSCFAKTADPRASWRPEPL